MTATDTRDADNRAAALTVAAAFGGEAPSIHNSQPWRWRIGDGVMDLLLERDRVLASADPDARLAVLSCGAALHHARLELAACGWRAEVDRLPTEAGSADDLARIRLPGRAARDVHAVRLVEAATHRRTDRRSVPGAPLDFDKLRTITAAVRAEGADLKLLRPQQVFALAEAAEQAQRIEREDAAWQVELEGWVGGPRLPGTGIPADALPADPLQLVAPGRALRRAGAALVAESRDHAAVFGILCTAADTRLDWLRAGEGLSAGWLTATDLEVSVLPLSIVAEVPTSRAMIRHLIGWDGYPYLALRFAAGLAGTGGARTPRLPFDRIVEYR
jgi:hypothetical protein